MRHSSNQQIATDRQEDPLISSNVKSRSFAIAFQFSLACLLAVSVWQMLGPEPQFAFEYNLQIIVVGVSRFLAAGLWIAGSGRPTAVKASLIVVCMLVFLYAGMMNAREYVAYVRVLEPALVKRGRIVHEGMGLSYVAPPNWEVDLQPTITRGSDPNVKNRSAGSRRLQLGQSVAISRISRVPPAGTTDRFPTWIVIEAQQNPYYDLTHFTRFVRSTEDTWAATSGVRIIRHTQHFQVSGVDMLDYEFVKGPNEIRVRTVWLRVGLFVVNVMLLTESDTDLAQFDEFLKSIRLGS